MLADDTDKTCLNMSKLNLYQCLAVAGPWYEDIFCLGEHALGETAQCLSKDAADTTQLREAMAPSPAALAAPTAAMVPTAVATPVALQSATASTTFASALSAPAVR